MEWDLGLTGLGVLALLAIGFGVVAQLLFWGRGWWIGAAAAVASFVAGILISEVWFGWATADELQPNIDGLSFDEVLLGFLVGVPVLVVVRVLARRRVGGSEDRGRDTTTSSTRPLPR
jgi:Na+/proline symporter